MSIHDDYVQPYIDVATADLQRELETARFNDEQSRDALRLAREAMGADDLPFLDDGIKRLKAQLAERDRTIEELRRAFNAENVCALFHLVPREKLAAAERELELLRDLVRRANPDDAVCVCHLHMGGCWACEAKYALREGK